MCKKWLILLVTALCGSWVAGKNCNLTTINALPLPDLGPGLYRGVSGGLYPGGRNTVPSAHLQAGIVIAESLQPLNTQGLPDANGKIVFISVGMSNTAQEFSAGSDSFISRLDGDNSLNPQLEIVNCAEPGRTVADWLNPGSPVYSNCFNRLSGLGLSREQVQAAWIKQAEPGGGCCSGAFPDHVEYQADRLGQMVQVVKQQFPNLAISHVSSRTRAYEDNPAALNPEPIAYETNIAAKWMIADQINGNPDLNYDPSNGPVNAPWLAWGPYIWVDGLVPRSDGLVWVCDDTSPDGIHPSSQGVRKVSDQLIAFHKTAPTAAPWFLKDERDFTVDIQTTVVSTSPYTVDFQAVASGASPVEWNWNFDDGLTSFVSNPRKAYLVGDTYTVVLTATDAAGNLAKDEVTIQVNDSPPDPPAAPTGLRIADP